MKGQNLQDFLAFNFSIAYKNHKRLAILLKFYVFSYPTYPQRIHVLIREKLASINTYMDEMVTK